MKTKTILKLIILILIGFIFYSLFINENITLNENNNNSGGETSAGIIEVAELPTENINENALYKVTNKTFTLGVNSGNEITEDYFFPSFAPFETYYVKTKPTENIKISSLLKQKYFIYFVEDENDLFVYADVNDNSEYTWNRCSSILEIPFIGFANNIEEMSTIGLYVCNLTDIFSYYKYNKVSGKWYEYIDKSTVIPSYESLDLKFHNDDDKLIEVFNRYSSLLLRICIYFTDYSTLGFYKNDEGNFYFIYRGAESPGYEIIWASAEMTFGSYSLPKGFSTIDTGQELKPLENPTIINKQVVHIDYEYLSVDSLSYVYPFNNYIYTNIERLLSLLGEITLH